MAVIPFVLVGAALAGVGGAFWAGHEWGAGLLSQVGGGVALAALRAAFWGMDLVAAALAATPVSRDWATPVLEGPALPIYALAALVMVAMLIAETLAGVITGNTTRIVQAVLRALIAGMLATAGASLLLLVGGAVSEVGRLALAASGTGVDAPLLPLQEVLIEAAEQREGAVPLLVVLVAAVVVMFASLVIYIVLAMRPVLLAALIVFLPVAHALAVWAPMRRAQVRAWSLAFAVLLADAAILTMFAVANTVMGQPEGVDRLMFGTVGLLLAAVAPAALARIVGAPELQTAGQSLSRGTRVITTVAAVKGGVLLGHMLGRRVSGRPGIAQGGGAGGRWGGGSMGVSMPGGPSGGGGPGSAGGAGAGTAGRLGSFTGAGSWGASTGTVSRTGSSGHSGSTAAAGESGRSAGLAGADVGPPPPKATAGWESALLRPDRGRHG